MERHHPPSHPPLRVVNIIGQEYTNETTGVAQMFAHHGYKVTFDNLYATKDTLTVFVGGSDVHPKWYGQEVNGAYVSKESQHRDTYEVSMYKLYKDNPKVGICRGGQLLNVMNGGTLVQDHGLISGYVPVYGIPSQQVHVDHHQGILHHEKGRVLFSIPLSSYKKNVNEDKWPVYGVFYEETKSLCFQPHPEWVHKPTESLFFRLLGTYLKV